MALEFRCVTKCFDTKAGRQMTAVRDVSFIVGRGEFVSIVGPSGCGKSTILSMTAGLYGVTAGEILVSGKVVNGPNPQVGFMLQKDMLLPWRDIVSNVEFGLEARGIGKERRRQLAVRELAHCHLDGFEHQYPHQLSGGMRQRAALARTLAVDPEIILLDEPFSALDAQTKLLIQGSFAKIIAEQGKTAVLITHDLAEAVLMSDRILVLSERPASIISEIVVDMPHRNAPLKRRVLKEVGDYAARIFSLLKLEEKAIA